MLSTALLVRAIFILVILLLIIVNWGYFKPVRGGPLSDDQKFSGEAWRIQQSAAIRDYLPITADEDPKSQRKLLEKEGVEFDKNGKVDLNRFGYFLS